MEENQLIDACFVRVHERAKKKGLVTNEIDEFIQKGPDFTVRNK
jgi:hypothetical protein